MTGVITKKHFFLILKNFGWRKAFKLLTSKEPVALLLLVN